MAEKTIGDDEKTPPLGTPAAPTEKLLRYFKYDHLPVHLQTQSKPFGDLAGHIVDTLKPSAERTVALRKLLEAKDCAVRAALPDEPA